MSLARAEVIHSMKGFPRVSGDEPYLNPFVALQNAFSPRERG